MEEALRKGALIIDVRTPEEFKQGNVMGSINIPVHEIGRRALGIPTENKVIITCCASGMRSAVAAAELKKAGKEVINGGSWKKVATIKKRI